MEPRIPRGGEGPEAPIKRAIKKALEARGWLVVVTHGNKYQSGLPDLFCAHRQHGHRWIEVKYAGKYSFTKAQLEMFPKMVAAGQQIWVLTSAEEHELAKLLNSPCNWNLFLGKSRRTW